MSALTKIFVVLLFIFSITFTSMMVAVVARTTNWKETAEKYREIERICDTNLRHAHAASAARLATARDEVRSCQSRIADLESRFQEIMTEMASLRTQLAKLEAERSNAEAINRGLLAQLQVAEDARSEFQNQRNDLETRGIDLERRNVDLNDRVNELTAKVSVMIEQQRHYEQQINILKKENDRLSRSSLVSPGIVALESPKGAALQGVKALTPVAATAIRGRVLEVDDDLITISVGSADGVKKDMVFVVHRGNVYVGELKISLVDPHQSAGRLILTTQPPAPNDEVIDSLAMGRSRG